MGKRKKSSRAPQGKKRGDPLPTVFTCLFCNHENSVTVKIDKKAGIGSLECKVCGQRFQCTVNCMLKPPRNQTITRAHPHLSAAVDVYGEWVDAAEEVAKDGGSGAAVRDYAEASRATRKDRDTANNSDDGHPQYSGDGIVGDDEEY
ncbi:transcription elongation [Diaporthe amygdali]|uniref:transcription elongation n=1 Tax=Phomopsis amygdali TaxID=1214568 RepID=UPI0022FEA394|nr:transcription elongation [Diaporthe amygdali]KAJ0117653.1 transcription elongation [Diaporthe amygdali]